MDRRTRFDSKQAGYRAHAAFPLVAVPVDMDKEKSPINNLDFPTHFHKALSSVRNQGA